MQQDTAKKDPYIPSEGERWWTASLYFSGLFCFIFPLLFLMYVVLVWNLKKKHAPFLAERGRVALNFHLSYTLLAAALLGIVSMSSITMAFSVFFIPLIPGMVIMFGVTAGVLFVLWFFGCIYCGFKTLTCANFKYPLVYPIFK